METMRDRVIKQLQSEPLICDGNFMDTRAEVVHQRHLQEQAEEAQQLRKLADLEDPTFGIF